MKNHKEPLHMPYSFQRDILKTGEYGNSSIEDDVNKEDEALEDNFVHNLGSGKNLEDPWGEAMASIIEVWCYPLTLT